MLDIIRWQMENSEKEINYVKGLNSDGYRWQKAMRALHRSRSKRLK